MNQNLVMSKGNPEVHIDHVHAHAICQGIGEWLRDDLEKLREPAPRKLHDLWERLPELDRDDSPSGRPPVHGGF